MRLLIDINVILDVALQRAGAAASGRLLALCGVAHDGFVAWHSIATLAYLIDRDAAAGVSSREFIRGLLQWAQVAPTSTPDAVAALDLPMADFEDALQAAAALACGGQIIVTRNERDFKRSPVPAMNPDAFLRKFHPAPRGVKR